MHFDRVLAPLFNFPVEKLTSHFHSDQQRQYPACFSGSTRERLVIVTESVNTGERFTDAMRHLIGKHKPDLVWLDPLLSFIGDDVSKQDVCSYFLRNLLNPISFPAGVPATLL